MVKECCEEGSAFTNSEHKPTWVEEFLGAYDFIQATKSNQRSFWSLPPAEKQAWANIILKEMFRHMEDIHRGWKELEEMGKQGIVAQNIFINTWIEVLPKSNGKQSV